MSTPITYATLLLERYRTAYDWTPEGTARVLDVGCGNAIFTQWLRDRAPEVYGLDHNLNNVRYGREHYPDLRLSVASGEAIPFADETFDAVVCSEVIEHVDDDQALIEETYRVLRPGGTLVLTTPHRGLFAFLDGENVVNGLFELVRRMHLPKPGGRRVLERFQYRHHRHYSQRQLEAMLGNRFTVEEVHLGGLWLYPQLYLIEKGLESFFGVPLVQKDYRLLRRMRAWDYRCRWGRLAYNVALRARKRE
jgi:ubiquinone/menaquinone biosynthesis C-methylase UbiE